MKKLPALKTGPWKLSDISKTKKNGLKVFSTFSCGGGSTMGWKLAGYEVIGCVEIDPQMMKIYEANHKPNLPFMLPIQKFNEIPKKKLPPELFRLDVLDGSPPCSSFSMAGSREEKWGGEHSFREGQATQKLDDLFFDFIRTVDKLRPKVVVAENVKGLIMGNAKGYVLQILKALELAGYDVQLFLLNASRMGVPQKRERTFFIARRKDLKIPPISFNFEEPIIGVSNAIKGAGGKRIPLSDSFKKWWKRTPKGKSFSWSHPTGSYFNSYKLHPDFPANTSTASGGAVQAHWDEPVKLSPKEQARLQTFPDDYNFLGLDVKYVCGMSVPPFMMQRVANQIAKQCFNLI